MTYSLPSLPIVLESHGKTSPIIEAMVHKTPQTRQQGLAKIRYMPPGWGALFVFPKLDNYLMTVKDTYLTLDVLFADANGVVHTIRKSVAPGSQTPIGGDQQSKFVLELPGGFCECHGVTVGARLLAVEPPPS